MKKILSLTMALTMLGTALTGCGSKDAATKTPAENTQQEQSQTEKALALINTFATGDTDTARSLLADGYIQHNLAYGTGADAFIGSVEYLASADVITTVNNIRAFEDGDKVFLQTIYNFAGAGEQVAFDIFRFDENGKIAEHWDNLAALAEPNPSGHTQTDGTMDVTDLDKTEENRELVQNFLYDVMQGNNLDKTPDYFDGDNYIQHNSGIADGVSGLNAALGALAEQGISMVYDDVHMVLAQGDFVLAVSEGTFGGTPTSYYDLWRVENGKIAEHAQLMEQRYIALSATKDKISISLRGKIKNIGSEKLDEIFEKNTYMQSIYPGDTRSALEVFYLYEADGEYFDISDPSHIVRDSFTIGKAAQEAPGYYVGEGCIGCKLCYSVCPQKCIDITKKPVVIDQYHCLHCGRCAETCPKQVIEKRG